MGDEQDKPGQEDSAPGPRQARPTRGPNGRYIRTDASAERDAEALRHRSRGLSYRAIAMEMGWADVSSAHDAVQRALAATIPAETAADVRQLELDRLDRMFEAAVKVLEGRHITVSQGRIIVDPESNEPLADDAPILQAIDRMLRIQDRRAKLLGLDAETKVNLSGGVTYEIIGIDPGEIVGTVQPAEPDGP